MSMFVTVFCFFGCVFMMWRVVVCYRLLYRVVAGRVFELCGMRLLRGVACCACLFVVLCCHVSVYVVICCSV